MTLGASVPRVLVYGGKMQNLEMISFNINVPGIEDEVILESLCAALGAMIHQYKQTGLPFTDVEVQEYTRLTVGDHIGELVGYSDHDLFSNVYNTVIDQLEILLATYWLEMEEFTNKLDDIEDIMRFWYPGLIRLCVIENKIDANRNSQFHLP